MACPLETYHRERAFCLAWRHSLLPAGRSPFLLRKSFSSSSVQTSTNAGRGFLDFKKRRLVLRNSDADNFCRQVQGEELQSNQRMWDTLRGYPKVDLGGKTVLVRCDFLAVLQAEAALNEEPVLAALPTLSYLMSSGARIVIASHWSLFPCSAKLIADVLSKHLGKPVLAIDGVRGAAVQVGIKALPDGSALMLGNLQLYKEEAANDKEFAKGLAENIDILVNDSFSICHRALASTVGVACFTRASLAGLQLEKELIFLSKATSNLKLPYVAIIGGSRPSQILPVLHNMVKICSTIVITGGMVYTFLRGLGLHFPPSFIESAQVSDALEFLRVAVAQKVDVILPIDFVCIRERHEFSSLDNAPDGPLYTSFRSDKLPEGWEPLFLGQMTVDKINQSLGLSKMALWMGPLSISSKIADSQSVKLVARTLGEISKTGCTTVVGGKEAIAAVREEGVSSLISHVSMGGSAFLDGLRGVNLPGVSALDFAYPDVFDFERLYKNPNLPLIVDVGCGNGLFLMRMAQDPMLSHNLLGLEVRKKLVARCSTSVVHLKLSNVHFVEVDAATMFKRIVSSYPGEVFMVAIQCPVPNFLNTQARRQMVQPQLIADIIQVLSKNGKIFLQSDVKSVAEQLRKDFLECGGGCLGLSVEHQDSSNCDAEGWLLRNPFGVSSDWEDHVLERGDRMYRVLLSPIHA